jgi:microcin C transport system substrate-binding protein
MIRMTRRTFLRGAGSAITGGSFAGSAGIPAPARAEDRFWRHGIALFDDLKYPAEFVDFDYVNPQAPKGGAVRQGASGTYDNFNVVVAGLKGDLAAGIDLVFETLLTPSLDEPSAEYGLLAEAASYPPDFSSVTYRLRREARWHDGKAVTPEDVIFSFDAFRQNNPQISTYYRRVMKAERTGDRDVTFTFAAPFSRELPQIVGQLTILPKHWWTAVDASGHRRDVSETTLEKPLGSGPYRIKEFEPGRFVVYERVSDHWARDLNVNIGQNNFAELRFDYFRDLSVEFEAFKADQFDWRVENTARNWATGYDFAAVKHRRVVLEQFPIRNVGIMQAFAFNTRRAKFRDPRLRRAFNFAFDFEQTTSSSTANIDGSLAISKARSLLRRGCHMAASSNSLKPCRTRCRRRYLRHPTGIRFLAATRRGELISSRRCECWRELDSRFAILSWSMPRLANRSPSNSCSPIQVMRASPLSTKGHSSASASRSPSVPSATLNTSTDCANGIST